LRRYLDESPDVTIDEAGDGGRETRCPALSVIRE
jgi:hypothetical protein